MATFNISWTPCGPSSDAQYIYYGKSNVVTGTPVSGTGWTLYTGAAIANSVGSATINGLDDNVEYLVYGYCHCPAAGNGPLSNFGPVIKYACPTLSSIAPTYNGVSYNLAIPNSANNTGTWIQKILVNLYDSSLQNLLQTNTYNTPFNANVSGSFTALNASSNYNLQAIYSDNTGVKTNQCGSSPFTTSAPCTAPIITVNNATANTFDVSWTPTTGGTFDVLVNNNVVATGLTTGPYTVTGSSSNTSYQVNVRKNCTTGGNAVSQTQNITTAQSIINGTISMSIPQPYTTHQQDTTFTLTFPVATPAPVTLYIGALFEEGCGSCSSKLCRLPWGYEIFALPSDVCPGYPVGAPGSSAYVINVPAGVTTYSVTNITQLAPPVHNCPGCTPLITLEPHLGPIPGRGWTDLYVKLVSPAGYVGSFTYQNSANIQGVTINNI